MRAKQSNSKKPADKVVKDIRRATRQHFSAEDKIRIVLEGLRGDDSIAELCGKEGIAQSFYYTCSKEFMEVGTRRLAGDRARSATTDDVKDLRREAHDLEECVADLTRENRMLKKVWPGMGETTHEIFRIREAGDYSDRPTIAFVSQQNPSAARHSAAYLRPLVLPLSVGRAGSSGRPPLAAKPGVEPYPREDL